MRSITNSRHYTPRPPSAGRTHLLAYILRRRWQQPTTLTRVIRRILKLLPPPGSAECVMTIRGWQQLICLQEPGSA